MAGLRLVMDVKVKTGNEHSGRNTLPGLLKLLNKPPAGRRPKLVRSDCGFGSDGIKLGFVEADRKGGKRITGHEYPVLMTTLDHEVLSLGQL